MDFFFWTSALNHKNRKERKPPPWRTWKEYIKAIKGSISIIKKLKQGEALKKQ